MTDKDKEETPKDLSFAEIQKKLAEAPKRNLEGSLEQVKEELRDAYMNFKDLQSRCEVDISTIREAEKTVYYFKPDTFLLDEPDKQRQLRENLLKKVAGMPKPEPITYLGDELHRAFVSTVQDQSTPPIARANLALYFKRRQYALQHLKYKMLNRWAHLALTSNVLETSKGAVFLYGKLEYSLEQSMQRTERLEQEDGFEGAKPQNRPNTKAEKGSGSLYVENLELPAQSLIREDDIEIFTRSVAYRNKVSKVVNKFLSRLKWLPLQHRYEIFEKALKANQAQKKINMDQQMAEVGKIEQRVKQHHIMTPEVESELTSILGSFYCRKHQLRCNTQTDLILNSWRDDHDSVPELIHNQHHLKIKIMESAEPFGLVGDMEIDNGYAFTYQVSVKFPQYFQKQVIQSQFSLYDIFAADKDSNSVQKHTLNNMTRIDTNIFRDISTTRNQVPDDKDLAHELRNSQIKVMRLKSAGYWLDYVCLEPLEPDWHKQQQAMLNQNNPIDSLLVTAINFLDVNDLASVNRVNEDNAIMHQQAVKNLLTHNPHEMFKQKVVTTQDGEKKLNVNLQEGLCASNEGRQVEVHLLSAIQGKGVAKEMGTGQLQQIRNGAHGSTNGVNPLTSRSGLRSIPQHLLVSYYTLRYMKSRDAKTKILYVLNFYRSIQKRIALDLREFGSRERIDSHFTNPFTPSTETDKRVVQTLAKSAFDGSNKAKQGKGSRFMEDTPKMTVFDDKAIAEMKNLASMRQYKCNGFFNNKILSTCPSFPKFHTSFGEPIAKQGLDVESDSKLQQGGITNESIKLMGRIDHVEFNEDTEEVYVKDDFGIYIMIDCSLADMKNMEEELAKIGSHYLSRGEVIQDPHTEKPQPSKDRMELLQDLLLCEARFQYRKAKLVQQYMECYEHVVDPLEQQRLMQIITDLMARRPRLNLQANYFVDSYEAEIDCLERQLELVKILVQNQINLERTQNGRLQDELSLSYTLVNQYEQNKFKYSDAETLLKAVIKNHKMHKAAQKYTNTMIKKGQRADREDKMIGKIQKVLEDEKGENEEDIPDTLQMKLDAAQSQSSSQRIKTPNTDKNDSDQGGLVSHSEMDGSEGGEDHDAALNEEPNLFQNLLGLPEISIETLYLQYKEKDKSILKLMNEHTNFIQVHEGYPEFLTFLQGGDGSKNSGNSTFKPCPWSQEQGNLDFYDSLAFINKFYAIMAQITQELVDVLKPHNVTIMTRIEQKVTEFALKEFQQVIKFTEGAQVEYAGRQYVEDESIVGNSEKMLFFTKEMMANLTKGSKKSLDPYLIAKLDIETINYFDFPQLPREDSKYANQFTDGAKPAAWVVKQYRQQLVDAAKRKAASNNINLENIIATTHINLASHRNVNVPSLLEISCNLMEFMRLRHEIILTASECALLKEIYVKQGKLVGLGADQCKVELDGISFDEPVGQENEVGQINYIDEGPARQIDIGLSAKEFDPLLLSNFNFRNPDSFKICITTAGLEEVRAVLTHQLMHKHLLIVACRANQQLIDPCQRAFSEIKLLSDQAIVVPNAIINTSSAFSRNSDSVSNSILRQIRTKFSQNLSQEVQPIFYNVRKKTNNLRSEISSEYRKQISAAYTEHPAKIECVQRIMRAFKVKQLTKYCQQILNGVYLDAQKVQALQVCQSLRVYSHYFGFNPSIFSIQVEQKPNKLQAPQNEEQPLQIFNLETSKKIENFSQIYQDQDDSANELQEQDRRKNTFVVLQIDEQKIVNYSGIPSSSSLMKTKAATKEELEKFQKKQNRILKERHGVAVTDLKSQSIEETYPERQIKVLLPTMTPKDVESVTQNKGGKVEEVDIDRQGYPIYDYYEALNFADSSYAKMIRYYQFLERIFKLEWFLLRLQFKSDVAIHIDNAFKIGMPFWKDLEMDAIVKREVESTKLVENLNPIGQNWIYQHVVSQKSKKFIAEELISLSQIMTNLMIKVKSLPSSEAQFEYLNCYTEFRHAQILGSLHKLVEQFYIQKRNILEIRSLKDAIRSFTKTEHVRLSYSRSNSYHVNTSLVHPQMQLLETTNLISGAHSEDEMANFLRCIRPVINERAMEPAQLSLFLSMYQTDSFRKRLPTQFAGQFVSTHNTSAFPSLETALLDLPQEMRKYAQSYIGQIKFQATEYMEMVIDPTLKGHDHDQVFSQQQLLDAKKFISDCSTALLLKQAVMCWQSNAVLPDDSTTYQKLDATFREQFFWKIIEQRENLIQHQHQREGDRADGGIPSTAHIEKLKNRIDSLQANYSLATRTEEEQRDEMVEALQKEYRAMKKKVAMNDFYQTKANIMVLSNEIEKFLTKASVQALDSEAAALANCFRVGVAKIQLHIHPFQQFAATFYDKVDPNLHLDLCQKVVPVQSFLTKLRNRGTEVETLTSGPGMVFTIKDINECISDFCRQIVKYGETELKSRSDLLSQKEEHYLNMIYLKDRQIDDMKRRIEAAGKNMENLIAAKLFEKGNQLIYQQDTQSRILTLFKQTMYGLETEIMTKILGEQSHKFKLQKDALDSSIEKLNDYKQHVYQIVSEKFSVDADKIMQALKKKVDEIRNFDQETTLFKAPQLYPASGTSQFRNPNKAVLISTTGIQPVGGDGSHPSGGMLAQQFASPHLMLPPGQQQQSAAVDGGNGQGQQPQMNSKSTVEPLIVNDLLLESVGTLPGAVVPEGFKHYSHCSCFKPNKTYPNYTFKLAEMEMLSEQQARFELARVCEVMRKQRLFWRFKEMLAKQKFQNELNLMKKQLSNNSYLWDQMAESEKREKILKQELLFTQQSLSASEKVIEKLQEEMKKVEADRQRLYKYKHSKAERLKELEDKVKKVEVFENIDTDKLITVLAKKDQEVKQLQEKTENYDEKMKGLEVQKDKKITDLKSRFLQEQIKTQSIVEKMEQMKLELKMLESNDSSVAAIWKKKCLDLFEVCQTLKNENEDLRDRCKDLIEQGIQLTDAMNIDTTLQNVSFQSPMNNHGSKANVSLPKLLSNNSAQRIAHQKLNPVGTALTTNRVGGASTANTYEFASNMGGYPIDEASSSIQVGGSVQRPDEALRDNLSPNNYHLAASSAANGSGGANSQLDQEYYPMMATNSRLTGTGGGGSINNPPTRQNNKIFTSTLASAPGKNHFQTNNQFNKVANGVVKTPQEQYMLAGGLGGLIPTPGLMKHGGHLPSTAHQQARNRSVGPIGGSAYQSTRPGQFTRQKPRHNNAPLNQHAFVNGIAGGHGLGTNHAAVGGLDLGGSMPRNMMGNTLVQGGGSEFVGDTSFNASFQGSSSLGGQNHPLSSHMQNRSLLHQQRQMNATTAPHAMEKKRQSANAYNGKPTNKQAFANAIRRQQALAGGQKHHDDSLFESSKASTNMATSSIMKRQFQNQKSGRSGVGYTANRTPNQHFVPNQNQLGDNTALYGSHISKLGQPTAADSQAAKTEGRLTGIAGSTTKVQSYIQSTPQANKAQLSPNIQQQLNIEGIGTTSGRKNETKMGGDLSNIGPDEDLLHHQNNNTNFAGGNISLNLTNKVQTDSAHLTEYVGQQIQSGDTSTRRNQDGQNVETHHLPAYSDKSVKK